MDNEYDEPELVQELSRWRDKGWTAQVIKNEDDEGWAVAMYLDGQSEPALVGPWTMGRDKKNPKPLDTAAFNTLVKTASEFIRRAEQQRHAELNRSVTVDVDGRRIRVRLAASCRTRTARRPPCVPWTRWTQNWPVCRWRPASSSMWTAPWPGRPRVS